MPLWSCGGALHALLSLWVHNVLTFSFTSWTNKSPTCRWYSCTLAEPHKVWKFASHGKFLLFHWTRKCGSGEGLQGLLGIWGNVEACGGTTRGSKSCCQERKEQQRRKKKCMDMNVFYKKDQKSTKVFLQNKYFLPGIRSWILEPVGESNMALLLHAIAYQEALYTIKTGISIAESPREVKIQGSQWVTSVTVRFQSISFNFV